jgi:hypothetical protein
MQRASGVATGVQDDCNAGGAAQSERGHCLGQPIPRMRPNRWMEPIHGICARAFRCAQSERGVLACAPAHRVAGAAAASFRELCRSRSRCVAPSFCGHRRHAVARAASLRVGVALRRLVAGKRRGCLPLARKAASSPQLRQCSLVQRLGPTPDPVMAVGSAVVGTHSQPSQCGIGHAIGTVWPGCIESQRSSIAVSSCVVLWQCST